MNNGILIGGFLGFLAGIALVVIADHTQVSLDLPRTFTVIAFTVLGGAIGQMRRELKERTRG